MKQIDLTGSTLVILKRGEELQKALMEYTHQANLKSAWLSGVGGAQKVTLGFYNIETKAYQWKIFNEPLEILSLTGNLTSVDDQPFWHIHGIFSTQTYDTIGGHVKELLIGLTGELYVTPFPSSIVRTFDDVTGLNLIDTATSE